MNKIEKMKRNQRIKETFFKCLHIISYILATLFIIIAVVSGVKGCSNKQINESQVVNSKMPNSALHVKRANNPNILDYDMILTPKFNSGNFSFNNAQLRNINTLAGVTNDEQLSAGLSLRHYVDIQGYIYYNGNWDTLEHLFFIFESRELDNGDYYYRLVGCIYDRNSMLYYGGYFYYDSDNGSDYTYSVISGGNIVLTDNSFSQDDLELLSLFFNVGADLSYFTFDKFFDYNAPSNFASDSAWFTEPSFTYPEIYTIRLQTGYFVSNGMIFDYIDWMCWPTRGSYFNTPQGELIKSPNDDNHFFYDALVYGNSVTHEREVVNRRNQVTMDSPYLYAYLSSTTWVNDDFRYITFLQELDDYNRITLNSFNEYNSFIKGGNIFGTFDVFSLLSLAFTSLGEFWGIYILPGITIGVLFFMPFVVGLIVVIFRMVKR